MDYSTDDIANYRIVLYKIRYLYVMVLCSCTSIPSESLCTTYQNYFQYTKDIDLLQLEINAMNYIEETVTNHYCRNYLRTALCVTIYPPCNISNNGSVQRLCPEECYSLLYNTTCSSDTEGIINFLSNEMEDSIVDFTMDCSDSLNFAYMFLNKSLCKTDSCYSILDSVEVPNK